MACLRCTYTLQPVFVCKK